MQKQSINDGLCICAAKIPIFLYIRNYFKKIFADCEVLVYLIAYFEYYIKQNKESL